MMLSQSLSQACFHHSLLPVTNPPTNRGSLLRQRNPCISSLARLRIDRQISRRVQRAVGKEQAPVDYEEEAMMEAEEAMEEESKGSYADYAAYVNWILPFLAIFLYLNFSHLTTVVLLAWLLSQVFKNELLDFRFEEC